jgi:hypothetical protein
MAFIGIQVGSNGFLGLTGTTAAGFATGALAQITTLPEAFETTYVLDPQVTGKIPYGPFFARGSVFWGSQQNASAVESFSSDRPERRNADVLQRAINALKEVSPLYSSLTENTQNLTARAFLELYGYLLNDRDTRVDLKKIAWRYWHCLMCADELANARIVDPYAELVGNENESTPELALQEHMAHGAANMAEPDDYIKFSAGNMNVKALARLARITPDELISQLGGLLAGGWEAQDGPVSSSRMHPYVQYQRSISGLNFNSDLEAQIAGALLAGRTEPNCVDSAVMELAGLQQKYHNDHSGIQPLSQGDLARAIYEYFKGKFDYMFDPDAKLVRLASSVAGELPNYLAQEGDAHRILYLKPDGTMPQKLRDRIEFILSANPEQNGPRSTARKERRDSSIPPPPL